MVVGVGVVKVKAALKVDNEVGKASYAVIRQIENGVVELTACVHAEQDSF